MPATDWQSFLLTSVWQAPRKAPIAVGHTRPHAVTSPDFRAAFPRTTELLDLSRRTDLRVGPRLLRLHSWGTAPGPTRHWLCPEPAAPLSTRLFHAHALLMTELPGILEPGGTAPGDHDWLVNQTQVLTADLASDDVAATHHHVFDDLPSPPIDLAHWYPIAREANGDLTLCHRDLGDILLLAQDPSRRDLRPAHTARRPVLFHLTEAPGFVTWVETLSRQWLGAA